jgi:hypothetical protein
MNRFQRFQKDVDDIPAPDYEAFRAAGPDMPDDARLAAYAAHPGLRRYDDAFDKVFAEVQATPVTGLPAVWLVYNMGLVVKTPKTTFAIDLAHRQGVRMAPLLDFALVTHNHIDHVDLAFLAAMDRAGKTVVSNFLCNYGAMRGGKMPGGYTRRKKVFKIGDVSIRTALSDHNGYLVDFTSAFEIRVGGWTLYHTGDCGKGSEGKLHASNPDLWVFFPGCGINVEDAVRRVRPKHLAFGHLWELGHKSGRLTAPLLRNAFAAARRAGAEPILALWGERLS